MLLASINDRKEARELVNPLFKEKWKTGFDYNKSELKTFSGIELNEDIRTGLSFKSNVGRESFRSSFVGRD